jgi:hypothetical protein
MRIVPAIVAAPACYGRASLVALQPTLAPFFRASDRPTAMACLRLLTFRPEPLFNVPRFRRRIVDSTDLDAPLLYFAIEVLRQPF